MQCDLRHVKKFYEERTIARIAKMAYRQGPDPVLMAALENAIDRMMKAREDMAKCELCTKEEEEDRKMTDDMLADMSQ